MDIEFPTNEEIISATESICYQGLQKKENTFQFIFNMTKFLGIKNIFHGVVDVFMIGLISQICMFILFCTLLDTSNLQDEYGIIFVFIFSPLCFLLLSLFSFVKEKQSTDADIKMTCKYTTDHITAYRMFVFSIFSFIVNAAYIITICTKFELNYITYLSVSLSSLAIFSCLMITIMLKVNFKLSVCLLAIMWITLNMFFAFITPITFSIVLKAIPIVVWIIIAIFCIWFYYFNVTNAFLRRGKFNAYC